jgi:hypothetical protein
MDRSASSRGGGEEDGEAWFEVADWGGESLLSGQGKGLLCANALVLDIPVPR